MPGIPELIVFSLILVVAAGFVARAGLRLRAAQAEAAAALRVAEARGRCLGLLAQDLQAPGLALLGHAGALPVAAAGAVAAEARVLLRLADDITEYLAAEAGPRVLRPDSVALLPLLEEAIAVTAARLGPVVRQWRLGEGFAGLVLHADRRALRGALLQVLARAARLTRDGDWIDLRPHFTPDSLAIIVEDEGAGLGVEDLAIGSIRATEADRTRGLGFGLTVARSLLEAHGGALRLEALAGVGARAWLTLPRERVVGEAPLLAA